MRATIQGGLESLLVLGLVLAGLGGLVAGGMYIWQEPQTTQATITLQRSSPTLDLTLQPAQEVPTQLVELPTPIVQTQLVQTQLMQTQLVQTQLVQTQLVQTQLVQTQDVQPVAPESPVPVAPVVSVAEEIPAQPNQPEPQLAPLTEADADAAAMATATAQVQCQTPNTWFMPTGAIGKPRITARFGKQAEDSPYFLALLNNGLIAANAPEVFHSGIDFAADANTPLFAVADGEVTAVDYSELYGKHLLLKTRDGEVLYAHLNEIFVKAGDAVTCSQPIGLSGATGKALTGAHLHLELRNHGKPVDPMPLIKRSLAADKPDWLR
jgi:murein DD-endopeptidase MepM/ murein hydrolase activator NlpD